jgi:hypothetical protein
LNRRIALSVSAFCGLVAAAAAPQVDVQPLRHLGLERYREQAQLLRPEPQAQGVGCKEKVPIFRGGKRIRRICASGASGAGLTLVSVADDWLPGALAHPALGYRKRLLALANERFEELPKAHRAHRDRFLELYGITPSFGVLRARLADTARHRCHAAIDNEPLKHLDRALDPWQSLAKQRNARWSYRQLDERLRFGLDERKVSSFAELAEDPRYGGTYAGWLRVSGRVRAIAAAQAHLRCDGLLQRGESQVLDALTLSGLERYFRKHRLVAWTLAPEGAKLMASPSAVLDYRSVLRALRERVVDATGLIEDGSAGSGPRRVMGQRLDAQAFNRHGRGAPLANAASDRIGHATEVAARALGWTNAQSALASLRKLHSEGVRRVAVRLPALPSYHSRHMDLFATVDRGAVLLDYPFTAQGHRRLPRPVERPTLVLWARTKGKPLALLRWTTTVGGWKPERRGGGQLAMVYKESPVGPRVWRDLIVAPRWIPPANTPGRDLIRRTRRGYQVKRDLVGPSYASAYGLMMLIHHRKDSDSLFTDQGIRTHGSVSYASIHQGTSHGCHRLHNHRAVRLGNFLLRHRSHRVQGEEPLVLRPRFAWRNKPIRLNFATRGFRYELTPPVPIEVERGQIVGKLNQASHRVYRLPANVARRHR